LPFFGVLVGHVLEVFFPVSFFFLNIHSVFSLRQPFFLLQGPFQKIELPRGFQRFSKAIGLICAGRVDLLFVDLFTFLLTF
jgi:hypothetical protein